MWWNVPKAIISMEGSEKPFAGARRGLVGTALPVVKPGDNPSFPDPNNYGVAVYKQEGNRFNYLFFDGHVSRLTMQQTVGTGTTNVPRGMWMLNPNNPYY